MFNRFILYWLYFWIIIALINIPTNDYFKISIQAYLSITATIAILPALIIDVCMDLIRAIRNGK